ncbi:50S ribosomal protein L24 [Patescibacteria group bacterium]|nr:50S ribosomal protein L24 [Patescibacteria group bacterium]
MKIKKNDTVLIISGKDRGKKGKILQSFPKKNIILVEGVNLRKKHQRSQKMGGGGQIIEREFPISISNAKLICPKCGKAAKVGYKIVEGKKYRACRKCGQEL